MNDHPGYMILDTEGSGLFDYKLPADADGQPRLASLSIIYTDADLNVMNEYHAFVRPEGWEMSEGATKVNGLTNEYLNEHGKPAAEVLGEYHSGVDNGHIVVAHNAQHDLKQLRAESRRAGLDDRFDRTPNICTMRALTDVCQIPPKSGRGAYKWPSLSEACVFFDMDNLGDHSAKADAQACLDLLRKLKEMGKMPEAKVHFAKNKD